MLSCAPTFSLMYNPREIFHFTQSDDVFGLLVAVTATWSQSNEESQNKGDFKKKMSSISSSAYIQYI